MSISRTQVVRGAVVTFVVVVLAAVFTAMFTLDSPAETVDPVAAAEVAKLEPVPGTKLKKITLTAPAAKRLGIETSSVQGATAAGEPRLVVPYAAVLWDPAGTAYVYTNPQPLVYVRHAIVVESIQVNQATLAQGPAIGTAVVSVGVAELYGTELGIGGDG
jgi:hypothetical protein